MKLGILVNSDKHCEEIIGITKAALNQGHEVIIFPMDIGTKLLENPDFVGLSDLSGVSMSYCELSSKNVNANTDGLPKKIKAADQYSNSIMQHEADRVLVF